MYRCSTCGQPWDDNRARDNELTCTRRCGGQLVPVEPLALPDLEGCDFGRLPYPVALTGRRLAAALQASGDVLKTLFLLKDCFEATIKYLGAVLLAEYRRSPACTTEHNEVLLKSMVRPSLGTWVSDVVRPLSLWLIAGQAPPGNMAAALFAEPAAKPGSKPAESALLQSCKQFVNYRNDALGHGAQRRDSVYEKDLAQWLPLVRLLLDGVAGLAAWRLCLVTAEDRCQVWLGPQPGTGTDPGSFSAKEIGHFVLRGPGGASRDLYPFLCYLADSHQKKRLHYYDSLYRYQATKKEVTVLEYDNGERHPRPEPVAGLEEAYTAELLAQAFKWHRGRMEIIEGRVANFGELIEAHAVIVGRQFVIDHVRDFLNRHDRGLLVVEAQPGKGKTALMAHLIEEVFGQHAPRPAHFFYRRTAGITDPDVCVRSLYAALLETHGITEAEESKQQNSPEEVYIKLTNLLSQEIAPRLLPGRAQLIFLDALDEAAGNALQRIPENLPAGVYIIATTRPVSDRTTLARRQHLHWYDLDAPDLLQENLRDGFEYVQRELVGTDLPNETLDEIARIGGGNFLVLKLLCQHLRTTLPPDQVADFLRRLATDGGKDQLGYIYAEFWQRLTERCTREDVNLLCDVAGVMVTAHAPLTAHMVCGVLGLRAGDWDFALRHLAEYLTVVEKNEEGVRETFYRVYHESFADFLRDKVGVDRDHFCNRLADYCLNWSRLPEGDGRRYALRFGPRHQLEAGREEEAARLLLDLFFLEAKTEAGMVFELERDLAACSATESDPSRPNWGLFGLIRDALRPDLFFLAHHPKLLFQSLWNNGWWHDGLPAKPDTGVSLQKGNRLSTWLQLWREEKEARCPGFCWLRSLRPPPHPLGAGQVAILTGHEAAVKCAAIKMDGSRIASGSDDHTVRVWDLAKMTEIVCMAVPAEVHGLLPNMLPAFDKLEGLGGLSETVNRHNEITTILFSSDGRFVIAGSRDGIARCWDASTGEEREVFDFREEFRQLTEATGAEPDIPRPANSESMFGIGGGIGAIAQPPGVLILATHAGVTRLYDFRQGTLRWQQVGASRFCMAIAPDASLYAFEQRSGGSEAPLFGKDLIDVYRLTNDDMQEVVCPKGHRERVTCLTFSPDGSRLASGSMDLTLRVWDLNSGAEFRCLRGHTDHIQCVAFAPDSHRVVSGSEDGTVRLWDIQTGCELACYIGHHGRVNQVGYSPDGSTVYSAGEDSSIRIWSVPQSGEPPPHSAHQEEICMVTISPNEETIVSGDKEGALCVWDTRTGKLRAKFRCHEDQLSCAVFVMENWLVTGGYDGTVRLWDLAGGNELARTGEPCSHRDPSRHKRDMLALIGGHEPSKHRVYQLCGDAKREGVFFKQGNSWNSWDLNLGHRAVSLADSEHLEIQTSKENELSGEQAREPSVYTTEADDQTLTILCRQTGRLLARFPGPLRNVVVSPAYRTWAGAVANRLYLFTLEGVP